MRKEMILSTTSDQRLKPHQRLLRAARLKPSPDTKTLLMIVVALLLLGVPYHTGAQSQPKTIAITAHRFAFEPAQITLKKGEPVTLQLTTADVTHGFYLKPLKIDGVIEPGKTTELHITPQVAGTFTTICDHFCGANHGNMKMTIVVEE